jgi:hypothetical protein
MCGRSRRPPSRPASPALAHASVRAEERRSRSTRSTCCSHASRTSSRQTPPSTSPPAPRPLLFLAVGEAAMGPCGRHSTAAQEPRLLCQTPAGISCPTRSSPTAALKARCSDRKLLVSASSCSQAATLTYVSNSLISCYCKRINIIM